MPLHKLIPAWLKYRAVPAAYTLTVFAFFIAVYALHRYAWSAAGYALLLSAALGLGLALWDFALFYRKNTELNYVIGKFPTSPLSEPKHLTEQNYQAVINALEAERARLERENSFARRDAEEYYTLWAHQIKTPIAAAQLLMDSHSGEGDIRQELFKISQYVDMVLQYQRLSSLENDLRLEKFSVLFLVKQAVKGCSTLFIGKGLGLDMGDIGFEIVTDKKWFCFVIEQLLTNAVKYTARGTVKVYGQAPARLIIEDCGIGIPAEDLPRVFERGFTGAQGRTERSSTGIGLYLSRRILHKLGFDIKVESEAGKGTKVTLELTQQVIEQE